MSRCCILYTLLLVGFSGWISLGCIAGVHHQRIASSVDGDHGTTEVTGSINSVDLGIVADFRYFRVGMPFEGQRRKMDIKSEDGSGFGIDGVVEMRTLRLDVPLLSVRDFSEDPSGKRYPGSMKRRHSLEIWASGSVGVTPMHPATATAGLVYYKYGAVAVRLFGGLSTNPYEGVERARVNGAQTHRHREGYAGGAIAGVEFTLAAGEYGLEMIEFIRDWDKQRRRSFTR